MVPIWGRQDPGGSHVGPRNLAIWVVNQNTHRMSIKHVRETVCMYMHLVDYVIYVMTHTLCKRFIKNRGQFPYNLRHIIVDRVKFEALGLIIMIFSIALNFGSSAVKTLVRYRRDQLLWRYNERDGVLNHRGLECLPKRLFRRRSERTSSCI